MPVNDRTAPQDQTNAFQVMQTEVVEGLQLRRKPRRNSHVAQSLDGRRGPGETSNATARFHDWRPGVATLGRRLTGPSEHYPWPGWVVDASPVAGLRKDS